MNALTVLLIIYMIFLMDSLLISGGRLITPGVLFFGSFSAMLLTANILNGYLKFQLKEKTFWLIVLGGFIFFLTEQAYRMFSEMVHRSRKMSDIVLRSVKESQPIIIQPVFQKLLVAFMIFSVALALLYVFSIVGWTGSWSTMMYSFRNTRRSIDERGWMYSLLGQTRNLAQSVVYICLYIIIYNKRVCSISIRQQKRLILVVVLFIPMTLIGFGARQPSVELIMFIFLTVFMLMPVSKKKLSFWKLILYGTFFLIAFTLIFTGTAALVGRADKYRNPVLYITDYLCGGIINLNRGIEHPGINEYWGQETFANVYRSLAKYGIFPDSAVMILHANGWSGKYASSTTVTIFGRWFEDFGPIGVYVMIGVVALFFSWLLYSKCNRRSAPNKYHIIYIWFSMVLVWAAYDDRVYSLISIGTIIQLIWVSFLYWLLIGRGRRYVFTFGKKRSVLNSVSTLTIQGRENNR